MKIPSIPQENCHHSQTNNELPTVLLQSSFHPDPDNHNRLSVILNDAQAPQEVQDKLPSLLQNLFDSIVSKSSTDVGRTVQNGHSNHRTSFSMQALPHSI